MCKHWQSRGQNTVLSHKDTLPKGDKGINPVRGELKHTNWNLIVVTKWASLPGQSVEETSEIPGVVITRTSTSHPVGPGAARGEWDDGQRDGSATHPAAPVNTACGQTQVKQPPWPWGGRVLILWVWWRRKGEPAGAGGRGSWGAMQGDTTAHCQESGREVDRRVKHLKAWTQTQHVVFHDHLLLGWVVRCSMAGRGTSGQVWGGAGVLSLHHHHYLGSSGHGTDKMDTYKNLSPLICTTGASFWPNTPSLTQGREVVAGLLPGRTVALLHHRLGHSGGRVVFPFYSYFTRFFTRFSPATLLLESSFTVWYSFFIHLHFCFARCTLVLLMHIPVLLILHLFQCLFSCFTLSHSCFTSLRSFTRPPILLLFYSCTLSCFTVLY